MKKRKLTKKEFEKLEPNLFQYLSVDTKFTIECYGGELLAVIMALKLFSQLNNLPEFILKDFQKLVEGSEQKVIEQYPGVQLIDFDDPARYFMSLSNAESDVKVEMALNKLGDALDIIHQQFAEDVGIAFAILGLSFGDFFIG